MLNEQEALQRINESIIDTNNEFKLYKALANAKRHELNALRTDKAKITGTNVSPFEHKHLAYAINFILQNETTAVGALRACALKYKKEARWVDKVKKYIVYPSFCDTVINTMLEDGNPKILLLEQHGLLKKVKFTDKITYCRVMLRLKEQLKKIQQKEGTDKKEQKQKQYIESLIADNQSLRSLLKNALYIKQDSQILILKHLHPKLSYTDIGNIVGVSRQKVSTIIKTSKKTSFNIEEVLQQTNHSMVQHEINEKIALP